MPNIREAHIRHAKHYLSILRVAEELYVQGGESLKSGLALFNLEWSNIQVGQAQASRHSEVDNMATQLCMEYPDAGASILNLRQLASERICWLETMLRASRQLKQLSAEGKALSYLGRTHVALGEYRKAIDFLEKAIAIARELGDRRSEGQCLSIIGSAYGSLGEYRSAINLLEQAVAIAREIGDQTSEGEALEGLAFNYFALGDETAPPEFLKQAETSKNNPFDLLESDRAFSGPAYESLGTYRGPIDFYERRLTTARETGDRKSESQALISLAEAYFEQGFYKKAISPSDQGGCLKGIAYCEQAVVLAREIGNREIEDQALIKLANFYISVGNFGKYLELSEQIGSITHETDHAFNVRPWSKGKFEFEMQRLDLAREIGDRMGESQALINIAEVYAPSYSSLCEHRKAIPYYEQACNIKREIGDRIGESKALSGLASAYESLGEHKEAILYYERCIEVAREIEDRELEGSLLWRISMTLNRLGQRTEAITHAEMALKIYKELKGGLMKQRAKQIWVKLTIWRIRQKLASWRWKRSKSIFL